MATDKSEHQYTNHLIHESSPYLLQHAHNPVDWHPWGEEALKEAKEKNKLLLISIGYAACHWCHVMEHESFEDTAVARYMNDHFVCIKVDREERPDIDNVYMNAVQLLTGSGGWPLNAIALPDGRPIYGGTYFPKAQWLNMLRQVYDFTVNEPAKAEQQAKSLTAGIQKQEIPFSEKAVATYKAGDLENIFTNWSKTLDYKEGGANRAPKFPLPIGYTYLLQYHYYTGNQQALEAVNITLTKMAQGGIFDQIGGGFARYSTDVMWLAPHFEKMLYDNGQLVSLYAQAFLATKNPLYKEVVYNTTEFVKRELTNNEGAFYSSLDADSEGEEGKFYVWTQEELNKLLGEDASLIEKYYNVKKAGNWEHGNNILHVTEGYAGFAKANNITETELRNKIEQAKKILMAARDKRVRPGLDDKVLTSWNALMLKGYVDAAKVFADSDFLNIALRNANFIRSKMQRADGGLYRNYKNGKASINAFLDDYAFTISAYTDLYQATFDEQWLKEALRLTNYCLVHFYDKRSGMFYYTSDVDDKLIARKMEIMDNVIPAANSEMAKNLFVLGQYFYKDDFVQKSQKMLSQVKEHTAASGAYFANWDILLAWQVHKPYEVAIVGPNWTEKKTQWEQKYLPNVFLSGGATEGSLGLLESKLVAGKTKIYVCQDKECLRPVEEVDEALQQIKK